tara:strand:- start:118 stop:261 length:144 start_codon:yes stop_codon:yes gene_type:complete
MDEKEAQLIIRALDSYWEHHMDPIHPDNKYDFLLSTIIIQKLKKIKK